MGGWMNRMLDEWIGKEQMDAYTERYIDRNAIIPGRWMNE